MGSNSKIDIMEFTLNVLMEHEKNLDELNKRFEGLLNELSDNQSIVPNNFVTVGIILKLIQYKSFENPYYSFMKNPVRHKEHILHDKRDGLFFLVSSSAITSTIPFWTISVSDSVDFEKEKESHHFNSEAGMFSWIISYMLKG